MRRISEAKLLAVEGASDEKCAAASRILLGNEQRDRAALELALQSRGERDLVAAATVSATSWLEFESDGRDAAAMRDDDEREISRFRQVYSFIHSFIHSSIHSFIHSVCIFVLCK